MCRVELRTTLEHAIVGQGCQAEPAAMLVQRSCSGRASMPRSWRLAGQTNAGTRKSAHTANSAKKGRFIRERGGCAFSVVREASRGALNQLCFPSVVESARKVAEVPSEWLKCRARVLKALKTAESHVSFKCSNYRERYVRLKRAYVGCFAMQEFTCCKADACDTR